MKGSAKRKMRWSSMRFKNLRLIEEWVDEVVGSMEADVEEEVEDT